MLAEALDGQAAPARYGLMTVGSSLLKIALHPAAKRLRGAVATIVRAGGPWLDVQSLTDILNFYGSKPARASGGRRRSGSDHDQGALPQPAQRSDLSGDQARFLPRPPPVRIRRRAALALFLSRDPVRPRAFRRGRKACRSVRRLDRSCRGQGWDGRAMSLTIAGKIAWRAAGRRLVCAALSVRTPRQTGRHRGRSEEIRRARAPFRLADRARHRCRSSMR